MPEFFTLIVALLAAVGVVSLTWLFLGGLPRFDSASLPVIAVLRVPERPADLQRAVRRVRRLSQWGAVDLRIILADDGMADETRKQADILLREDPGIVICTLSEVAGLIR